MSAALLVMTLAVSAAGCTSRPLPEPGPPSALRIAFEDVEAPSVFAVRANATVSPEAEGAGLWAAAPGLPRPERGRVRHLATGASVDVALFRGDRPGLRLSAEAAEVLGVGAVGAPVEVVALRREPRLEALPTAF